MTELLWILGEIPPSSNKQRAQDLTGVVASLWNDVVAPLYSIGTLDAGKKQAIDRQIKDTLDDWAFPILYPQRYHSPSYSARVEGRVTDGTRVFSARGGVVPSNFTLTKGGVVTCALPQATIVVTRTAGGTIGEIDESIYNGPGDRSSNFRIDSCQYIYNLGANALGAGTYRLDLKINNQVVGSAVLQLK